MLDPQERFVICAETRSGIAEQLNDFVTMSDTPNVTPFTPNDDRLTAELCTEFARSVGDIDIGLTLDEQDDARIDLVGELLAKIQAVEPAEPVETHPFTVDGWIDWALGRLKMERTDEDWQDDAAAELFEVLCHVQVDQLDKGELYDMLRELLWDGHAGHENQPQQIATELCGMLSGDSVEDALYDVGYHS